MRPPTYSGIVMNIVKLEWGEAEHLVHSHVSCPAIQLEEGVSSEPDLETLGHSHVRHPAIQLEGEVNSEPGLKRTNDFGHE